MPWIYISEEDKEALDNIVLDEAELEHHNLYPVLKKLIPFFNAYNDPQVDDRVKASNITEKVWFVKDAREICPALILRGYESDHSVDFIVYDKDGKWTESNDSLSNFYETVVGSVSLDVVRNLMEDATWANA